MQYLQQCFDLTRRATKKKGASVKRWTLEYADQMVSKIK